VQGNQVGFESSLQQHLDVEQRRAVLEAIGGSINPDSTLGEIIDAAEALGWSEKMGDLSLADLAEALLAPDGQSTGAAQPAGAAAADDEGDEDVEAEDADDEEGDEDEDEDEDADEDEGDEDEDDDDDEEEDFALEAPEPAAARRKGGRAAPAKETKAAAGKKKVAAKQAPAAAGKKAPGKKAAEVEPARGGKKTGKKIATKPGKKVAEAPAAKPARGAKEAAPAPASGKKTGKKLVKRKLADVDVDDRMSLDQAAEFFLPYVEELGEATMQALEEQTGVSRRKLRFHVGQLVKHGYLERHGMGRGTYYTRC